MKRTIFILMLLTVIVGGYFLWKNYSNNSVCDKNCERKSGNYSLKMSLVCVHACAAKNVDKSKVVEQTKAQVGDYTKCPVSGVLFLVTEGSSKVSREHKTAFTCCATCAGMFNESPGEYVVNIN